MLEWLVLGLTGSCSQFQISCHDGEFKSLSLSTAAQAVDANSSLRIYYNLMICHTHAAHHFPAARVWLQA